MKIKNSDQKTSTQENDERKWSKETKKKDEEDENAELTGLDIDNPSRIIGRGTIFVNIQYKNKITKVEISDVKYVPTMDKSDIIVSHGILQRECDVSANLTDSVLNEMYNGKIQPIAELILLDNNL
ncbi:hypothetical protein HK096_008543, partial [Nowakowskiella sp. JEL0078]